MGSTSAPCPARDFPPLENLAPVPAIIDPFEEDFIPVFCTVFVGKDGKGVQKVKGRYTSELIVRDNDTGMLEVFSLDSGKFRTDQSGVADLDFEIPAPIFADGFESGDVSAWSYTRTEFTNKKPADQPTTTCAIGNGSGTRSEYRGAPAVEADDATWLNW